MWKCGVTPERTHCVDRKGLKRKQTLYIVSDCPKSEDPSKKCRIKQRQFNELAKGAALACQFCHLKRIGLHDVEEDDYEET